MNSNKRKKKLKAFIREEREKSFFRLLTFAFFAFFADESFYLYLSGRI